MAKDNRATSWERELVVYFSGQTMKFGLLDDEHESQVRKLMEGAVSAWCHPDNNGAFRTMGVMVNGVQFFLTFHFIGWTIRDFQLDISERIAATQEKLARSVDPDADAPWKGNQGEE